MPPVSVAPSPLVPVIRLVLFLVLAGCFGADAEAPAPLPAEPAPEATQEATPAPEAAPDTTRPELPDGFVRLSEMAPEIAQEMRYFTDYNFVGEVIDGYLAPECILSEQAAAALKRVAADLEADGYGLKVYDCYRPQQAVSHFARWASGADASMKTAFYPDENRGRLFQRGYIATRSGHSRGSTVDLTLVDLPAAASVISHYPARDALKRCDRPRGERLDEADLDMGTAYDCLDNEAATASGAVSREAQRNRQRLKSAMERRGFRNYSKEWWHFTLNNEPFRSTYHNFPVE